MHISIIVITKNRADTLRLCLTRLTRQIQTRDEIIVVDNNSTDHTREIVEGFSAFPVRYVKEKRPGASQARNAGFRRATKEGVAFLDDDSLVLPDWLHEVRRTLTQNARRFPDAVYQGKIIQRYRHRGVYEMVRKARFAEDLARNGMGERVSDYTPLRIVLVGNIFSYRKTLQKISGPFDAVLFPFLGEDPDLACRLIEQNIPLLYHRPAQVIHAKENITLWPAVRTAYRYGRAKALLEQLYFSRPEFLLRWAAIPVRPEILPPSHPLLRALRQTVRIQIIGWFFERLSWGGFSAGYWWYRFLLLFKLLDLPEN